MTMATGSKGITFSGLTAKTFDATGYTGAITMTTNDASLSTSATFGSGNDLITSTTADAMILDGGAGTDQLTLGLNASDLTINNFEVLVIVDDTLFSAADLNGASYSVKGTSNDDIEIATGADDWDSATLDMSGLILNAQVAQTTMVINSTTINPSLALGSAFSITGTSTIDNFTGSSVTGTITFNGGAGADVFVGGSGKDTVSGGAGGDVFTSSAGLDEYDFADGGTAAEDVLTQANTALITISGFDTGAEATADELTLDISIIEGLTSVTDLVNTDAITAATGTASTLSAAFETVTAAATIGASAGNTGVIVSGNIASTNALETALEVGGDFALTATNAFGAKDTLLVFYDDGADSYLASVATTAGTANTFAAADLTAVNLVKFTGIADVTDIVAGNFNSIIA
jgi:hypothetical protein